jgi:hypothetical protein
MLAAGCSSYRKSFLQFGTVPGKPHVPGCQHARSLHYPSAQALDLRHATPIPPAPARCASSFGLKHRLGTVHNRRAPSAPCTHFLSPSLGRYHAFHNTRARTSVFVRAQQALPRASLQHVSLDQPRQAFETPTRLLSMTPLLALGHPRFGARLAAVAALAVPLQSTPRRLSALFVASPALAAGGGKRTARAAPLPRGRCGVPPDHALCHVRRKNSRVVVRRFENLRPSLPPPSADASHSELAGTPSTQVSICSYSWQRQQGETA